MKYLIIIFITLLTVNVLFAQNLVEGQQEFITHFDCSSGVISKDGNCVANKNERNEIEIYKYSNGNYVFFDKIAVSSYPEIFLISDNGKFILYFERDHFKYTVWDIDNKKAIHTRENLKEYEYNSIKSFFIELTFSKNFLINFSDSWIKSRSSESYQILDLSDLKVLNLSLKFGNRDSIDRYTVPLSFAMSPDEKCLAYSNLIDHEIAVYAFESHKVINTYKINNYIDNYDYKNKLQYTADGDKILVKHNVGFECIDTKSDSVKHFRYNPKYSLSGIYDCISPGLDIITDGLRFYYLNDTACREFPLETGVDKDQIEDVVFSPDNKYIVVLSFRGIFLCDYNSIAADILKKDKQAAKNKRLTHVVFRLLVAISILLLIFLIVRKSIRSHKKKVSFRAPDNRLSAEKAGLTYSLTCACCNTNYVLGKNATILAGEEPPLVERIEISWKDFDLKYKTEDYIAIMKIKRKEITHWQCNRCKYVTWLPQNPE